MLLNGNGLVVQLVRMLPCHGRGRGFESRPARLKGFKEFFFETFFILISILNIVPIKKSYKFF